MVVIVLTVIGVMLATCGAGIIVNEWSKKKSGREMIRSFLRRHPNECFTEKRLLYVFYEANAVEKNGIAGFLAKLRKETSVGRGKWRSKNYKACTGAGGEIFYCYEDLELLERERLRQEREAGRAK